MILEFAGKKVNTTLTSCSMHCYQHVSTTLVSHREWNSVPAKVLLSVATMVCSVATWNNVDQACLCHNQSRSHIDFRAQDLLCAVIQCSDTAIKGQKNSNSWKFWSVCDRKSKVFLKWPNVATAYLRQKLATRIRNPSVISNQMLSLYSWPMKIIVWHYYCGKGMSH